jgi:hypothetical protein
MVPHLETQLVEEKPQILLICDQVAAAQSLVSYLNHQEMLVTTVSAAQILHQPDEQAQLFYKVIWLKNTNLAADQVNQVLNWLGQREEPVVILTTCLSPLADERDLFKPWVTQANQDLELIQLIRDYLPDTTLLVGRDVVFSPTTFLPAQIMTHYSSAHTLVDPAINLGLQTSEAFFQAIQPNVLSPLPHQLLVSGREHPSSELIKKMQLTYQRQLGITPTIEVLETIAKPLPDLPTLPNPSVETTVSLAESLVSAFPLPKHREVSRMNPASDLPSLGPRPTTVPKVKKTPPRLLPTAPVVLPPPFVEETTPEPTPVPTPPKPPAPEPEAEIETQVADLFQKYRSDHTVERVEKLVKTTRTVSRKQTHKKKLFWAGLAFVGVGFGVVVLALLFTISSWWLQNSLVATWAAQTTLSTTRPWWSKQLKPLSQVVEAQVASYSLVLDDSLFETQTHLAQAGEKTESLPTDQDHHHQAVAKATLQLLNRGTGSSVASWQAVGLQAQALYDQLSQTQAVLKSLSKTWSHPTQLEKLKAYETWLADQKKTLLASQQLQGLLPILLGESASRSYVVVLQNNQELRPTGGFIQSVAVITVTQGVITDTQVLNAYDVDKKILGVVTPPVDITRYLGEKQWFLRDSNWNPDFPTTSSQIAWFVERATGKKVDGVVGLNLLTIKELLKALGPLDVPEYNEVLTDRNLLERMEFHSEIQLVPESTQPDYSTLVLTKLLQKINQMPEDKVVVVLDAIQGQLNQNQVLFSLTNPDENSSLTPLGWTGALLRPACPAQLSGAPCTVDVVAQVEANVGVNKANAYITRKTNHTVSIGKDRIGHHRTMSFTNTATTPAWPKGTYKNFIRLFVSPEAQLDSIMINQVPVAADQISIGIENKRKVFGVLVEVPVNQTVAVDVVYHLPSPSDARFAYALFDQRQSGVEMSNLTLDFTHDASLKPTLIAPQAQVKDNQIIFEQGTLPHTFVGVQFN